jgi:hypothetical protein
MKWLLETLIFIKMSSQSIYSKYFKIKKFFLAHLAISHENTLWTLAAMLDFKSAPKTQIW